MSVKDDRKGGRGGGIVSFMVGLVCFLAVWQLGALAAGSEMILPGPVPVARRLLALLSTPRFFKALAASSVRLLAGLAVSVPLGAAAGLASALDRRAAAFLRPFLGVIAATPVMSVILIAFLVFGSGRTPVFTVFLMVFPVIASNTAAGVRAVDPKLAELFDVYRVRGAALLRRLYLPALMPYLTAGVHSGLSLGWKVTVAAEVLVQPAFGLGSGMQTAKAHLETPELFAWTAAAILAASASSWLTRRLSQ